MLALLAIVLAAAVSAQAGDLFQPGVHVKYDLIPKYNPPVWHGDERTPGRTTASLDVVATNAITFARVRTGRHMAVNRIVVQRAVETGSAAKWHYGAGIAYAAQDEAWRGILAGNVGVDFFGAGRSETFLAWNYSTRVSGIRLGLLFEPRWKTNDWSSSKDVRFTVGLTIGME